jgi:hypothetical protein
LTSLVGQLVREVVLDGSEKVNWAGHREKVVVAGALYWVN